MAILDSLKVRLYVEHVPMPPRAEWVPNTGDEDAMYMLWIRCNLAGPRGRAILINARKHLIHHRGYRCLPNSIPE